MTKDIRKNIEATNKLNESLKEGPAGWAADKIIKGTQKAASKVTYGGAKSRLQQLSANRKAAAALLKTWNINYAAHGKKRLPIDVMSFLKNELKMSSEEIKNAWDQTSEVTLKYGKYAQVINQYKKDDSGERSNQSQQEPQKQAPRTGLVADPANRPAGPRESIEEAPMRNIWKDTERKISGATSTKKISTNDFRNLIINAIDVKNKATAEKGLNGEPEEKPKIDPKQAKALKQAGAKDMDGDNDYDWDDVAKQAVARGEAEAALDSIVRAIDPKMVKLVKSVLKGEVR